MFLNIQAMPTRIPRIIIIIIVDLHVFCMSLSLRYARATCILQVAIFSLGSIVRVPVLLHTSIVNNSTCERRVHTSVWHLPHVSHPTRSAQVQHLSLWSKSTVNYNNKCNSSPEPLLGMAFTIYCFCKIVLLVLVGKDQHVHGVADL